MINIGFGLVLSMALPGMTPFTDTQEQFIDLCKDA